MPQVYWPFSTSRVTEWPGQRSGSYHVGTDFGIPQGTPLRATVDGRIVRHNNDGLGAYVLDIIADDGLLVRNGHLSRMDVNTGDRVTAGQVIGLTGGQRGTPGAGYSFGPHLHWELRTDRLWSGGRWIDPRRMNPPVKNFGDSPSPPNTGDDDMAFNTIRHPNGTITFADEMGGEQVLAYSSPDIGLGEYLDAINAVWGGTSQLTARQFDIAQAIVTRRNSAFVNRIADVVAAKTGKATVDTQAVAQAVAAAVVAQGVKVDVAAIARAVEASLQDEFARIPKAVMDEQAARLKA